MSIGDVVGFKVSCSKLDRSVAFYRALGFEPQGEVVVSNQPWLGELYGLPGAGVRMQAMARPDAPKSLRIELLEWNHQAQGAEAVNGRGAGMLQLKSNDLSADTAALTAAGGEVVGGPATLEGPAGRTLLLTLKDPDGFTLQLVQFIRAAG